MATTTTRSLPTTKSLIAERYIITQNDAYNVNDTNSITDYVIRKLVCAQDTTVRAKSYAELSRIRAKKCLPEYNGGGNG